MTKKVFIAAMLLLICFAPKSWAYDFSAKCKSGQTLYYNVTSSTKPYTVEVASCESAQGDLVIPSTVSNNGKNYSVTSIGPSAFYKCKELKSLIIPSSVTSIGDSAFYRCEGLTSVNIPKSLNSIGNDAFGGCGNLTSIKIESDANLSDADLYFVKSGIKYAVQDKKSVKVMPNKIFRMIPYKVADPNSKDPDDPDWIEVEEEEEDYSCLEDSIVVIPETLTVGNTFTVTSIGGIAGYCAHVKSVTIPNTVTSIGNYAFSFETLESINIPNSVTSIGDGAFSHSGITSITIPNSVTSIGKHAFEVSSLASITIPNSVTSIGDSAFAGCHNLKYVSIPSLVRSIGKNAFIYCDSITDITLECDIDISDADLHVIKDGIKYTMVDKKSVKVAPDFKYVDYKIGGPYGYYQEFSLENTCPKGETIIIPETITAGHTFTVTSIADSAFQGCSYIESVTIPKTVTSIGEKAFSNCERLTTITIPNSVARIGDDAFGNIENVVYNGSATGSPWGALVVNGYTEGYILYSDKTKTHIVKCNRMANEVTIPNSVTSIGKEAFSRCRDIKAITIPNSVTTIGDDAFEFCKGLTSINIPNSVTEIGKNAFYDCTGLSSITIPNSVTEIGENAFYDVYNIIYSGTAIGSPWGAQMVNGYVDGYVLYSDNTKTHLIKCSTLAGEVTIPNSVTSIEKYAFSGCSGLTSILIPNSVTSIGKYVFSGCRELTSIVIPNSVTEIGEYAFANCSGLTSVTIGNSVTSIGDNAFIYCSGLTSVTIPNSVTSIGKEAFKSCRNLASVTIPNSVTTIGTMAFLFSGLTSITIPNSVTTIDDMVFMGCSNLEKVVMPNSVTSIGFGAFYGCSELTSVTISKSLTSIGDGAFGGCEKLDSKAMKKIIKINENAFATE